MASHRKGPGERLVRRLLQAYFRARRSLTLGVRAIVLDDQGRILLVRHTYVPGWHLPGGGVEKGQSVFDALRAELRQEGGLELLERPQLLGVYSNHASFPNDHVVLFAVRRFNRLEVPRSNREIAETGFFAPDDLPQGTTQGTRARIAAFLAGQADSEFWAE